MNSYESRQQARRDRLEARAERLRKEGAAALDKSRKMAEVIPFGQPILVGHHSEKRDRNYRDRIHRTTGKGFALLDQAEEAASRAAAVGTGGISSDDPEAIAKLSEELAGYEASQARMKQANALIRKHKTDAERVAALVAVGFSEALAAETVKPDFCGRVGFASYSLQNNSANMRRIRLRIEQLQAAAKRVSVEVAGDGYTYREDTEENRVMFRFPGKPDAATRAMLGSYAFRWSPTRDAWVRQLTNAGIYAAKCVKAALQASKVGDN